MASDASAAAAVACILFGLDLVDAIAAVAVASAAEDADAALGSVGVGEAVDLAAFAGAVAVEEEAELGAGGFVELDGDGAQFLHELLAAAGGPREEFVLPEVRATSWKVSSRVEYPSEAMRNDGGSV